MPTPTKRHPVFNKNLLVSPSLIKKSNQVRSTTNFDKNKSRFVENSTSSYSTTTPTIVKNTGRQNTIVNIDVNPFKLPISDLGHDSNDSDDSDQIDEVRRPRNVISMYEEYLGFSDHKEIVRNIPYFQLKP